MESTSDLDASLQAQHLTDWRRHNTAYFLQYLARAVQKSHKLPFKDEQGECILRVVQPEDVTCHLDKLKPYMFPPEFTDKKVARKSFKKYGHWKKVDYEWVELDKIGTPHDYNSTGDDEEIKKYWIDFMEKGIPIPAIRVYSDEDLTVISDGVQRKNALREMGAKYALVYFRYETNNDPPE